MELSNAGEHKKHVEFCRRILKMLDWSFDDASNFKSAIGEEYDDFAQPIQQPIVKEKKVYPNDPCPCGSGKNIRNAMEEKSKGELP